MAGRHPSEITRMPIQASWSISKKRTGRHFPDTVPCLPCSFNRLSNKKPLLPEAVCSGRLHKDLLILYRVKSQAACHPVLIHPELSRQTSVKYFPKKSVAAFSRHFTPSI